MPQSTESPDDQVWLWDLYPLADDAWPNVPLFMDDWGGWLKTSAQTIVLRRWVTGPNGPSFLTEYTPADDYITEGHTGPHDTLNGLYRDEDRVFYIPRPADLQILERLFPHANPSRPDWICIRVALCTQGYVDTELARTKAPVLIAFLMQLTDRDITDSQHPVFTEAQDTHPDPPHRSLPDSSSSHDAGGMKPEQLPCDPPVDDADDEQFGGPQEDPYDRRVVNWLGKRLYLGYDTQISRLFWLLAKKLGVPHNLGEVQRAVDGMETDRDEQGEEAFRKAMQRARKAISKLRDRFREHELDTHVQIIKEGPRDYPSYALILRFGNS